MVAGVGFFSTSVGMLTISSAFSLLPSRLRYSEEERFRKRNEIRNREREGEEREDQGMFLVIYICTLPTIPTTFSPRFAKLRAKRCPKYLAHRYRMSRLDQPRVASCNARLLFATLEATLLRREAIQEEKRNQKQREREGGREGREAVEFCPTKILGIYRSSSYPLPTLLL